MSLFSDEIINYQVKLSNGQYIKYVNFDNAATTPPLANVQRKVDEYLSEYGSVHRGAGTKSIISTDKYEETREVIKDFVNAAKDSYVIYTSNTTGAMNCAAYFFSFLEGCVAVSGIEHSSSWLPWIKSEGIKQLGSKQIDINDIEYQNDLIQVLGKKKVIQYEVNDEFEFDIESIEKILKTQDIKAFVLTASSNATGYCPNIKEIGEIVHKYGAFYIVDACQFIQHHQIDMVEMGIDFLAASGHKFYAPYGGGFLLGPKSFLDKFLPYEIGGGNLPYITSEGTFLRYENQLAHDPGTPNAIGAIAMSEALKEIKRIGIEKISEHEHGLAEKIYYNFKQHKDIELYVREKHLSTIIPFNIKGMNERELAKILNDDYGIGVRAGSFCVYNVIRKLLKINDDSKIISDVNSGYENAVPGFVRISVGLCNDSKDVDRIIHAVNDIIFKLKNSKSISKKLSAEVI